MQVAANPNLRLLSGARATGLDVSDGSITGGNAALIMHGSCSADCHAEPAQRMGFVKETRLECCRVFTLQS